MSIAMSMAHIPTLGLLPTQDTCLMQAHLVLPEQHSLLTMRVPAKMLLLMLPDVTVKQHRHFH